MLYSLRSLSRNGLEAAMRSDRCPERSRLGDSVVSVRKQRRSRHPSNLIIVICTCFRVLQNASIPFIV